MKRRPLAVWTLAACVALAPSRSKADEACSSRLFNAETKERYVEKAKKGAAADALTELLNLGSFEALQDDPCTNTRIAEAARITGNRELEWHFRHRPSVGELADSLGQLTVQVEPTADVDIDGLPIFRGCDHHGAFAFSWRQAVSSAGTREEQAAAGDHIRAVAGRTADNQCWQGVDPITVRVVVLRGSHRLRARIEGRRSGEVTTVATSSVGAPPGPPIKLVGPAIQQPPPPAGPKPATEPKRKKQSGFRDALPYVSIGSVGVAVGAGIGAILAHVNMNARIDDYGKLKEEPIAFQNGEAAIDDAARDRNILIGISAGFFVVSAASFVWWLASGDSSDAASKGAGPAVSLLAGPRSSSLGVYGKF